jgi:hypothetical protein
VTEHHHEAPHLYIRNVGTEQLATDAGFCTFWDLCRWAERNLPDNWMTSGYKVEEHDIEGASK